MSLKIWFEFSVRGLTVAFTMFCDTKFILFTFTLRTTEWDWVVVAWLALGVSRRTAPVGNWACKHVVRQICRIWRIG